MLGDLKKVEDSLYSEESIEIFLKTRSIQDAIRLLNKANKAQTKIRIKRFFYKLNQSNYYKEFLSAGLTDDAEKKEEFKKYITSDQCEEYYQLLIKKLQDVLVLLENNHQIVSLLFSLVYAPQGIKMIKLFNELYSKYTNHDCLYQQEIKEELDKGVVAEDSVVQMRFVEITANIAIHGGKAYAFVEKSLEVSLNVYETNDILLKLNIVQIVSVLGQGVETSQLLRGHKIWGKVQKDAMNQDQEFYVRKSLLLLLIQMAAHQQFEMTPKFVKNVIQFLKQNLAKKGQYLEAALEICGRLLYSSEGAKILAQNTQVFNRFLAISRTTHDQSRLLFIDAITMLTDKTTGKKGLAIIINILNCIGNPNLSAELTHNVNSNNYMAVGIQPFCKWFSQFLALPFQDLQLRLIKLFLNLIEYSQLCEVLFEEQNVTKFMLKPLGSEKHQKVLRMEKSKLIQTIIEKGQKEWKGTKLGAYSAMLEKQLKKDKFQIAYALDVQ